MKRLSIEAVTFGKSLIVMCGTNQFPSGRAAETCREPAQDRTTVDR
jgi:hypothetical protein